MVFDMIHQLKALEGTVEISVESALNMQYVASYQTKVVSSNANSLI